MEPWMQKLGPALFTVLTSHAGVSGFVGARVFPHGTARNPQMPYITYVAPLADRPIYVHASQEPAANHVEVQVDWWCSSYQSAVALGDEIFKALECADITIPGWGAGRMFAAGGWPIETATEGGTTYWRGTRRYTLLHCNAR